MTHVIHGLMIGIETLLMSDDDDVYLSDTHKQKEERERKEKRKLHPWGAQAETHDEAM